MHENAINRNLKKDRHPLDTACLMELATYKAFDKLDFRVVKILFSLYFITIRCTFIIVRSEIFT